MDLALDDKIIKIINTTSSKKIKIQLVRSEVQVQLQVHLEVRLHGMLLLGCWGEDWGSDWHWEVNKLGIKRLKKYQKTEEVLWETRKNNMGNRISLIKFISFILKYSETRIQ